MRQPRGWFDCGRLAVGLSGESSSQRDSPKAERMGVEGEERCPPISHRYFPCIEPSQKPADLEPRKHCLSGLRFQPVT